MNAYMAAVEQEADDFAQWLDSLTDAQRGSLALEFLDSLNTATGVVRSICDRAPWLGNVATVEFDGHLKFEVWLHEKRWPTARAKLREEAAEMQWEELQRRYA